METPERPASGAREEASDRRCTHSGADGRRDSSGADQDASRHCTYVGTVAEFSPTTMPLTLTPGRHHIELRVAGYQTMAFDMEVVAGQVIPYRGEMQPQR